MVVSIINVVADEVSAVPVVEVSTEVVSDGIVVIGLSVKTVVESEIVEASVAFLL